MQGGSAAVIKEAEGSVGSGSAAEIDADDQRGAERGLGAVGQQDVVGPAVEREALETLWA